MSAKQIQTPDGVEFLVEWWVCPDCGHSQSDSVHPTLGPFLSCTCGKCGRVFSDEQLDAESLSNWSEARDAADAYVWRTPSAINRSGRAAQVKGGGG